MTQHKPEEAQLQKVTVIHTDDDPASRRARRLRDIMIGVGAMFLALTICWQLFTSFTRYADQSSAVDRLSGTVEELRDQNAKQQETLDQINTESDEAALVQDCYNKYTNEITIASYNFQTSANGRLFVVTARRLTAEELGQAPPSDQEFTDALEAVETAELEYAAAIQSRAAWIEDGRPVPCPLG